MANGVGVDLALFGNFGFGPFSGPKRPFGTLWWPRLGPRLRRHSDGPIFSSGCGTFDPRQSQKLFRFKARTPKYSKIFHPRRQPRAKIFQNIPPQGKIPSQKSQNIPKCSTTGRTSRAKIFQNIPKYSSIGQGSGPLKAKIIQHFPAPR